MTRFFGREDEAAELAALCDRERLVTLVGAPGCGKTRLAVEVAARDSRPPHGGARFLDLAAVTDPAHLGGAIAAALGIREEPGRPAEESLLAALQAAAPVLVVVDNCEHVAEAVARFVERLLAHPEVRVLATSRVPLGLPGERVWPVPPLDVDAAVRLFCDRAVLASGVDPDRERTVVDQVCTRLDGLPLAIELAAAWVRVLSPRQIADRLAEALPLLAGGTRGRSPRHETMLATVEWSYRLLPPAEQRLFEAVSVFVGRFDLAAVAAVAGRDGDVVGDGGGDDVLPALAALVDHSLVLATPDEAGDDATRRYRVLEPVRQCGAALLAASGAAPAVRRRHAEHYLDRGHRFDGWAFGGRPTDPTPPQLLEDEGNLLAALDWARGDAPDLLARMSDAFGVLWEYGERVEEARAWLQTLLATPDLDPVLRAQGLFWDGRLAWRQGDLRTARRRLDDPALGPLPGDEPWVGPYLLGVRAALALSAGDTAAALGSYEKFLTLWQDADPEIPIYQAARAEYARLKKGVIRGAPPTS